MRLFVQVGIAGLCAVLVAGSTAAFATSATEPGARSGSTAQSSVAQRLGPGELVMLGDFHPGAGPSMPPSNFGAFWSADDRVFFGADDGVHGREPFVTDGTPGGTVLIGDVRPGPAGSNPAYFTPSANGVVFMTDDDREVGQIRVTTARGTGGDVGTTTLLAQGDDVVSLHAASLRGLALLATSDFDQNPQLWRSDGTLAGTVPLKQHLTLPDYISPIGDIALFVDAQNPLWRTDGTVEGTRIIRRWPDGPNGSTVLLRLTPVGRQVFFVVSSVTGIGAELWVSDGTKRGTRLVRDIRRGPQDSEVSRLTQDGRRLVFIADDGVHGPEVWRTDGTQRGTVRVTDLPGLYVGKLAPCGSALYFSATSGHGTEVYVRQHGRVRRVAHVPDEPRGLTCLGDSLAFTADDGVHGRELYTLASPRSRPVLHDLSPTGGSNPNRLLVVDGSLYFVANDGVHGDEPWRLAG
jgi:ELWxxDGT repeat protein